jgi:hypothetical protein
MSSSSIRHPLGRQRQSGDDDERIQTGRRIKIGFKGPPFERRKNYEVSTPARRGPASPVRCPLGLGDHVAQAVPWTAITSHL